MPSVYSATTEGEEALAAATAETVLQVRGAAAVKAQLREWGLSFDGTSAVAEPVLVEVLRQSTDGTSTAATRVNWDGDSDVAASVTAFHSFTAEPTAGSVIEVHEVHPQAGIVRQYMPDCAPGLDNAATSRIGIRCTAPAGVNVVGYVVWSE